MLTLVDDIKVLQAFLNELKSEIATFKLDQYFLYPSASRNSWEAVLFDRLHKFCSSSENELYFYSKNDEAFLVGLRFSEWDASHFGYKSAIIKLFFHSDKLASNKASDLVDEAIKIAKARGAKFISVRVNGDDLDFIHAFEESGFRFYENVIWPIKKCEQLKEAEVVDVRMMEEKDLERVMKIASTHQYQRGHFHCDTRFDKTRVNTMYAKWVESAWARGENIVTVECKGEIAGYFISAIDVELSNLLGRRYGRMKSLALDSRFRGEGLGRKLFDGTCQILANQGAEYIDSGYSTKNHVSAKLHTQNKFYSVYEEITLHKWVV